MTALFVACRMGWLRGVTLLLTNSKIDLNKSEKKSEYSPLHIACGGGHLKIVRLLLAYSQKKGGILNLNKGNANGHTPLHIAVDKGYIRKLLVCFWKWEPM